MTQIHQTGFLVRCCLALLFTTISIGDIYGQSLRICSYNMEDRPTSATDDQNMRVVMQAVGDTTVLGNAQNVDILAFQEGPENEFEYDDIEANMEAVFGGNYDSTITPPDFFGCRTGFVYNSDVVQVVGAISLIANLTHNCRRAQFRPVGGTSADDFYIYSIHLKAGTSSSDINTRGIEATIIRNNANTLPGNSQIIFCGDFNMMGSDEVAFQNFFAAGTNASAVDTLNTPFGFLDGADWRDDRAFLPFHTQDPFSNMDDRFDAFFVNNSVVDGNHFEYIKGSCSVLGNNGTHNLNQGINTGTGTSGFGSQLIALSDHLPVFCDFAWDQELPTFDSAVNEDSTRSWYVRQTGPVTGTSGVTNLEVEGSSNGSFAAFSVIDFDLSGVLQGGQFVGEASNIVLNMLQDNETFTDGGAVEIYVASQSGSQVVIDNSIQYQTGQNGINCVPSSLSAGAFKVATYAGVHEINGVDLPDGTQDRMGLYGDEIGTAVSQALNNDSVLRLLLVPGNPQAAATYAGYLSTLGAPSLDADLVFNNGDIEVVTSDFIIANGIPAGGNGVDITTSNDVRVGFQAAGVANAGDPNIQVLFNGSFSNLSPQTFAVNIESVSNTPNIEVKVESFNFLANQWEELGSAIAPVAETAEVFTATGDVSRFIGQTDNVLTRVSWRPLGPVFLFPWKVEVDKFNWSITQ